MQDVEFFNRFPQRISKIQISAHHIQRGPYSQGLFIKLFSYNDGHLFEKGHSFKRGVYSNDCGRGGSRHSPDSHGRMSDFMAEKLSIINSRLHNICNVYFLI